MEVSATLVREEINRVVRPGQPGTAVSVHRGLHPAGLRSAGALALFRQDHVEGTRIDTAVYGRGIYGASRYADKG